MTMPGSSLRFCGHSRHGGAYCWSRPGRKGPRLCENVRETRMPRIVFSFAYFRQKLPVQLVSTATKSRWKFYAQVGRRSFHTAWTRSGPRKTDHRLMLVRLCELAKSSLTVMNH